MKGVLKAPIKIEIDKIKSDVGMYAPDYGNISYLLNVTNADAEDTIFNYSVQENGFIQCYINTITSSSHPFVRVTVNGVIVHEYAKGIKESYIYRTTPFIPVLAGDTLEIQLGDYGVGGSMRQVKFYRVRIGA